MVVPCPFLRALRLFTSLVTTLGVALVNSLEGLKPLFFPCIFSPFSSFRVFRNATLPHFERFACAGREEKLLKKQATYDLTNSVVCKSSDHVSGGTTRASLCTRISHLLKIRSSLASHRAFGLVVPFLHSALTHLTFTRTHATLLSQNNLPKHLKWISSMCETQFFTPCQLHSTSGKVRIEQ